MSGTVQERLEQYGTARINRGRSPLSGVPRRSLLARELEREDGQEKLADAAATPPTSAPRRGRTPHPPADPYRDVRRSIRARVVSELGSHVERAGDTEDVRERVRAAVKTAIEVEHRHVIAASEREDVVAGLCDDILAHGPIEQLLADPTVSEVMCNGPGFVYVERAGRVERTDIAFEDDAHLMRVIERIVSRVNRRIDECSPMVDARLPDGSRVHAIIPPLSLIGPCLTIRKFHDEPMLLDDLVRAGALPPEAAKVLQLSVAGAANVLISGGTGTGKTTLLNAVSAAIPEDERIVTIEDAAELRLEQEHVIPLEMRPANAEGRGEVTIRELVRTSLRMRPDRIIVGECRGAEALDMLQSMNTGHDGSMTTIHANSPREALGRLETLVLTAGTDLPLRAVRDQIAGAIDIVVQLTRLADGTRRVTAITEVTGMEGDVVSTQDLFRAEPDRDSAERGERITTLYGPLRATGARPRYVEKLAVSGVSIPPGLLRG